MTTTLGPKDFECFTDWYSAKRRRETGSPARPTTVRTKRTHLSVSAQELCVSDMVSMAQQLTDRRAVEHLLERLSQRMSPGAMRTTIHTVRQFHEYAVTRGWTDRGCALTVADLPCRNPQRPITIYTPDETERLVVAARARGLRWWAFLATMVDTGRRVGEVLSLEWSWFHLQESPAYVELPHTKNGTPQYVPLGTRLHERVFTPENIVQLKTELVGAHGGRFSRDPQTHPFPWTYPTVLRRFEWYCEAIGVPYRGLHCLRHTLITRRIAAGVPIQAVAALAGHSSPATTLARYSHATALDYARYVD